jgi:hypothetical protein
MAAGLSRGARTRLVPAQKMPGRIGPRQPLLFIHGRYSQRARAAECYACLTLVRGAGQLSAVQRRVSSEQKLVAFPLLREC